MGNQRKAVLKAFGISVVRRDKAMHRARLEWVVVGIKSGNAKVGIDRQNKSEVEESVCADKRRTRKNKLEK